MNCKTYKLIKQLMLLAATTLIALPAGLAASVNDNFDDAIAIAGLDVNAVGTNTAGSTQTGESHVRPRLATLLESPLRP